MKPLFIVLAIILFIHYGCEKIVDDPNKSTVTVTNIHIGTKHNSLRGVTLTWQSGEIINHIKWGYTSAYEFGETSVEPRSKTIRNIYEFTFPVLKPLTKIHYSIKARDSWSEDKIFTSLPDTLSNYFSFIVGSDSHAGDSKTINSRWTTMSNLISNMQFDFFIHLGDGVDDNDSWEEWDTFFNCGKSLLEKKLGFYTWGNHEYGNIAMSNMVLPGNKKWYSFIQGNTLFICLLSQEDFDIQYTWLLEQLDNANQDWIIVYFHRPFFTRGSHSHEMDNYRSTWWRAFDNYGVDIVMSGHTHSYIRTLPINLNISDTASVSEYGSDQNQGRLEFVAGGLGGDNSKAADNWFVAKSYSGMHFIKIDINDKILHFTSYSDKGNIIDSLTIYGNK